MSRYKWLRDEAIKGQEFIIRATEELNKKDKISFFDDLIPELKDLKGKSYTVLRPGGSLEACEQSPQYNLGVLLGSGLYENIIVPIPIYPSKTSFEIAYGLSKTKGCHLTYEQFINLVKNEKVRITLNWSPEKYKPKFYEEMFKSAREFPPPSMARLSTFLENLRLNKLAIVEGIDISEKDGTEKLVKLHPEYTLEGCSHELEQIFGDFDSVVSRYKAPSKDYVPKHLTTVLWQLRFLGFERTAELALKCARLEKVFGDMVLNSFHRYLVRPLVGDLSSFENYDLYDVNRMSFFGLVPKKLKAVWGDILSSSPACSSISSQEISLNTVELQGMELLRLIEDFADNKNVKSLRKNVKDVDRSLSKFDVSSAENKLNKVDEIITESINSEVEDYARKGRIASHLFRLGKTFTTVMVEGSAVIAGIMAGSGRFDWVAMALAGTGVSAWAHEKLNEIKADDIVRWWSKVWPFEDPGIGFAIWEKSRRNSPCFL